MEAEGHSVPTAAEMPNMTGVEWIWTAWNDLNSCRSLGMGVGPIPWSAAERYATVAGMDSQEFALLWKCILGLETIYQDHLKERTEKRAKQHGSHGKRKTHR